MTITLADGWPKNNLSMRVESVNENGEILLRRFEPPKAARRSLARLRVENLFFLRHTSNSAGAAGLFGIAPIIDKVCLTDFIGAAHPWENDMRSGERHAKR